MIKDKIKLLNDEVLVLPLATEPEKKKGLYVPVSVIEDSKKKTEGKCWKAKVIDMSDKVIDPPFKVGDVVHLDPVTRKCPSVIIDDEEYVIVREYDIWAIGE
jgi:co-chaperonin GroES (HSP10)